MKSRVIALRSLLLFSCLGLPAAARAYDLPPTTTPGVSSPEVDDLQRISRGIAAIAKQAEKGIVFVSIEKTVAAPGQAFNPFEFFFGPGYRQGPGGPGGPQDQGEPPPGRKLSGLGSGFIVDLAQGYVITNNHVIEDADEIHLKLANSRTYEGRVVGRDKRTDIAVVQIKDKKFDRNGLTQLVLDDSSEVQVGDFAIALGAPFGLESSLSFGVVSAMGREGLGITELGNYIQTDAAINRGNSGGPLLNARGKVIGVNTAITSPTGTYAGIGFSVPSSTVRDIAMSLINDGKVDRGYIGIEMQDLDEELAKEFGMPENVPGILVTNVAPGAPAEKAGLKAEDVIAEVDGRKILNRGIMSSVIGLKKPGTAVGVTYYRKGKPSQAKITLALYPDQQGLASRGQGQGGKPGSEEAPLGLMLSNLTDEKARRFGVGSKSGALVEGVSPGSVAEDAGLEAGDVILNIDGQKIDNVEDVKKIVDQKGKKKFLVRIEREGTYSYRKLTL